MQSTVWVHSIILHILERALQVSKFHHPVFGKISRTKENFQVELIAVISTELLGEIEIILMQVSHKHIGQDNARIGVNRDRRRGAVIGGRS